jgi:pyruvate/oxaloacetate carboxyltransferase
MYNDGFESSHPIEANVTFPDEINNLFDDITLSNGTAVLRMLDAVVGASNIKGALRVIQLKLPMQQRITLLKKVMTLIMVQDH